ncbi:ATP-binding protein [Spirosoma luteolum]
MVNAIPDILSCEQEPIHILGYVQSHGCLVAVQPVTYTIVHISANSAELNGQSPAQLLGKPIAALLEGTDVAPSVVVELLNVGARNHSWDTLNPYRIQINGRAWNLITHEHEGLILLEWEPAASSLETQTINQLLMTQALTEVQSSRNLPELLQNTAERIKTIIGFDRVMVYRFSPDWHGEVVAEARHDHLEPFLGLHYPASDIPAQARELYRKNLVRLIADAGSTPAPILTVPGWPAGQPLDMTHAGLRAVSPIHIEYLHNMGVAASMSLSLLYRGQLWGLISCHNYTPRFVDYSARQTARFVSQLLSAALEFRRDEEDQVQLNKTRETNMQLQQQLVQDNDVVQALTQHSVTLLDLAQAGGAVLCFGGKLIRMGQTPNEEAVQALMGWLKTTDSEAFLQTSELSAVYPPAADFASVGSGLLALVLSHELGEYILWFKPEHLEQVTWAGNPEKAVTVDASGQGRLSPRQSFAAWVETVRGKSESWSETDVAAVLKLREDVLQMISRQANEVRLLNQRLKEAYDELDAFSYTVSHDLRTPLSSIRCYTEILLEEYGRDFNDDGRELFQKIIDSSDRMRALIRHILYYSRMGRLPINGQEVDMALTISQILDDVKVEERDRSLSIQLGTLPPIYGDPVMVRQLFQNLLTNAAKYTRMTTDARIQIDGYETESEVVYQVTDNGIGFDMKQADHMFELFKRLDNARQFTGSGVGLAIVKRIIDRHQGKIWFHSEPNRKTSFWVSFPTKTV